MSSESRTPDKKFETNRTLVLMLTVYSGVCIYSGRHMLLTQATSEWCRLPTTTHPNSRQIVAGRPDECKKNNFEASSCRHFNFKTLLQNAPEHFIFSQKTHTPRRLRRLDPHAFGARARPFAPFTKS